MSILEGLKPTKIIAVGLNYKDHARELNMEIPKEPVIFLKPVTSLIGHKDNIIYPKQSRQVDYEAELAVIIGKKCKDVSVDAAHDVILGYTCANDVTARDLQKKDNQWTRAKSFDTFCPLGPKVVKDIDLQSLAIELFLNGEVKQRSNTSEMIFTPLELVSFISSVMTLMPDDIIITGTPPGIGKCEAGDEIEVRIEGIGSLINNVVSG